MTAPSSFNPQKYVEFVRILNKNLLYVYHLPSPSAINQCMLTMFPLCLFVRFASLFLFFFSFAKSLSYLVDQADYDKLSAALVNISMPAGRILPLIRCIVCAEFEHNFRRPGSILRGNCVASKLMAAYSRQVSVGYLQKSVGRVVTELCSNDSTCFELDSSKLKGISEAQMPMVLQANASLLIAKCKEFINWLCSAEMLEALPREVRGIASFTAEYARAYASDRVSALVGGFLILRLVNPSLVTPDAWDVVPKGSVTASARRNLTLLSKVVQNLSNNIPFGSKEEYMLPMNPFIEEYADKFKEFFQKIIDDPLATSEEDAWADCKNPPVTEDFDQSQLEEKSLLLLHKVLHNYRGKLLEILHEELQKDPSERDFTLDEGEKFFVILDELGAPPGDASSAAQRSLQGAGLDPLDTSISFLTKIDKSGMLSSRLFSVRRGKPTWLVSTAHFAFLFASPQDSLPKLSLPIEDIIVQLGTANEASPMGESNANYFTLTSSQGLYVFSCQSQQEASDWYKSLLVLKQRRVQSAPLRKQLSPLELRIQNHITGKKQPYEIAFSTFRSEHGAATFVFEVTAFSTAYTIAHSWDDFLHLNDDLVDQFPRLIFPAFPKLTDPHSRYRRRKKRSDSTIEPSLPPSASTSPSSLLRSPSPSSPPQDNSSSSSSSSSSASLSSPSSPTSPRHASSSGSGSEGLSAKARSRLQRQMSPNSKSRRLLKKTVTDSGLLSPRRGSFIGQRASEDTAGEEVADDVHLDNADDQIGFDAIARPTRGLILAAKFLKAYMLVLSANIQTSQSDHVFKFLELDSPFRAVLENSIEQLQYLQQTGASFNVTNREGLTPLHVAVMHQNAGMLGHLHRFGANINIQDKGGNTPLLLAIKREKPRAIDALIDMGADILLANRSKTTPLHAAAEIGNAALVDLLLSKGGNAQALDTKRRSPLMLAILGKHEAVAVKLLPISDLTVVDDKENTLLHLAARRGLVQVSRLLLQNIKVDPNLKNHNDVTPLHFAAHTGNYELARLLLLHPLINTSTATADADGATPLCIAVQRNHEQLVALLAPRSPTNYRTKTEQTLLHVAVLADAHTIIPLICSAGVNIDLVDAQHRTALHLAIAEKKANCVLVLLQLGANPNIRDARNRSPLHTAAIIGHLGVVKAMLETQKVELNAEDDEGCLPLHLSIWAKKPEVVQCLVRAGSNINHPDTVALETPLHVAAASGLPSTVEFLVSSGASVQALQKDGNGPIHIAALSGDDRVIHALIAKAAVSADVIVNSVGAQGKTPVQMAIGKSLDNVVVALVKHGASLAGISVSKQLRHALELGQISG